MIKVIKKDGRQEDFDRNKLIGGMTRAGTTPEQANNIASQIETWMPTAAVENAINSNALRVKVMELLRTLNPEAANQFAAFQKPGPLPQQPTPTV